MSAIAITQSNAQIKHFILKRFNSSKLVYKIRTIHVYCTSLTYLPINENIKTEIDRPVETFSNVSLGCGNPPKINQA